MLLLSLAVLFTKWCGCKTKMQCCCAGNECSTNIPQRQSTQPEVVAIFVMDIEIREIAFEENDELSHEVDAIVGEWDILEFCYRTNWFTNTCTCIEMSKINRLTPNLKIQ